MDIITKIKKAKLTGRGGAGFPTDKKWDMVKAASGDKKYVICNASEGEPGIKKDYYILENYPERVIDGMKIAMEYVGAQKGYLFLNAEYYKEFKQKLFKLLEKENIELFRKHYAGGYIGGEETSTINAIEGNKIEPKYKPPYPSTNGLWDCPTLINNVETFYDVSLISQDLYEKTRFYTLNGDLVWNGVYEFPEDMTIKDVLTETKNLPAFPFFVQIGGDASGEILNMEQLDKPATGAGSITVYSIIKHQPMDLIKKWVSFFYQESCGQCTPCREGTYRLFEIINAKDPNWVTFFELINNLSNNSFCALGASLPVPINSFVKNVAQFYPDFKYSN